MLEEKLERSVEQKMCIRDRGNVAAVNSRQHGGAIEAQTALCVDELLIQTLAGFGVLLVLEALADEALDHADGGDVLLHGGVQVVVILENTVKNFEGGDQMCIRDSRCPVRGPRPYLHSGPCCGPDRRGSSCGSTPPAGSLSLIHI